MKTKIPIAFILLFTIGLPACATAPATSHDPIIKTEITQKPKAYPSNAPSDLDNPNPKVATTTITRPGQPTGILVRQLLYEDAASAAALLHDMLGITASSLGSSNTIIITGDTAHLSAARTIIDKIDIDPTPDHFATYFYHIQNADTGQLAATMQQVVDKTLDDVDLAGGQRPYVLPDTRTHSLLIRAPSKYIEDFAKILEELDHPAGRHQARQLMETP